MSRAALYVALVILLVMSVGCATPSAPDPVVAPHPVVPVPEPPSSVASPQARPVPQPAVAALAIEDAGSISHPSTYASVGFEYELRFRLRETHGISGATIQNIFVGDASGGGDNTGPSCWRFESLRVPPDGTLDTFLDWDWKSYCRLSSGGSLERLELRVIITFTDDDGREGHGRGIVTPDRSS